MPEGERPSSNHASPDGRRDLDMVCEDIGDGQIDDMYGIDTEKASIIVAVSRPLDRGV